MALGLHWPQGTRDFWLLVHNAGDAPTLRRVGLPGEVAWDSPPLPCGLCPEHIPRESPPGVP